MAGDQVAAGAEIAADSPAAADVRALLAVPARVTGRPAGRCRGRGPCAAVHRGRSIGGVEFSRDLRDEVIAGGITVSFRLWRRPKVRAGGRYRVGPAQIEVDSVELVPFAAITPAEIRRAGEAGREELRQRAAHAGPVRDDTLLYRVEFHLV